MSSWSTIRRVFALFAGPLALSLLSAPVAAQSPAGPDAFHGRWVLVAPNAAQARRDRGVDRTVSEMSALVRGIARRRIRDELPVPREIEIRGERVRIGDYAMNLPESGAWRMVRDGNGNLVHARRLREDGALTQVYRSSDGELRHTLRASQDTLELVVRLSSERLERDVTFRLTYRRAR